MKYPTVFHLIWEISEKNNILSVLIGGFAVNYYGITRQTADVDFLITSDNLNKITGPLIDAGYRAGFLEEAFIRFTSDKDIVELLDIDLMLVDKNTLDGIIKDGKRIEIDSMEFILPSLEHLIALKLHSLKNNYKHRENKDLPDIIGLLRINKMEYKDDSFKDLCEKYGTLDIYKRIVDRMEEWKN